MAYVIKALSSPGSRKPVTRAATTQIVARAGTQSPENELGLQVDGVSRVSTHDALDGEKPRLLDRYLDAVVTASGSSLALLTTACLILLWAFMGIRYGHSEDWQVVISDVQAVFCYIFDSLLVRQQLNSYDRSIRISVTLVSRSGSVRRMLRQVANCELGTGISTRDMARDPQIQSEWSAGHNQEDWISRTISFVGRLFGHVVTLILFWIGIFVWLAFGDYCHWDVHWQLYINSATSALMMLCFALIACTREQTRARTAAYLNRICDLDVSIERRLRQITQDTIAHDEATIYPQKVNRLQRAISYYADLVGTLVGIALLTSIMAIWIAIGPSLHFSSNWWLIIGTYAGLIGMHDGFVLHNIQLQLNRHEDSVMADLVNEDSGNLAVAGLTKDSPAPSASAIATPKPKSSITQSLSCRLSSICAHEYSVIFGIIVIVGLIIAATALNWSVTGQLLCNIPPSIIETFVMMALITSNELDDKRQYDRLGELVAAREMLATWLDGIEVAGDLEPEQLAQVLKTA
ncbi:hypothetical protein PV08_08528 [Exophiala spinifera]|uniref:Low affinity iron permease n=1 Tax=Exophiala spinifera TaxID=91928 RepID=A0A0D2B3T6_9EURO|nr:uncharacterized protein PV08_08528 [Exophiala spinifera]KIW13340.1 hypothetical protein PV08_08528 [Exophiala spinifera]